MILFRFRHLGPKYCIPRESGDDPRGVEVVPDVVAYSPRERG